MKKQILITDRFALEAQLKLSSHPLLNVVLSQHTRPTAQELQNTEILVIRSRTKITKELLDQAPNLRLIVSATSGFDHIDLQLTKERAVFVMHTPEANSASAAELTWSLVMASARELPNAHRQVKAGQWNREALKGIELEGKTFGIIGLGRIGSRVAKFANAFGMKVLAFDPFRDEDYFASRNAERVGLQEILKQSQFLSLHVPYTADTHHMLNRSNFEFMCRDIILINTCRGSVIKEIDLVEALEKGWLRAVGLDVFEKEPLDRNSNLLKFPNVFFTPHIGAATEEAFTKASEEAAKKIIAFVEHRALSDQLPPSNAWHTTHFIKFELNE